MDELLKKLKRKFTLYTALIAGLFLLFIFVGFFLLLFGSTEIIADETMQKSLENFTYDTTITNGKRIILITVKDDTAQIVHGELTSYGDPATQIEILKKAVSTGDGRFHINNSFFKVQSKQADNGIINFVLYDCTKDLEMLSIVGLIQLFVYVGAFGFLFLLAYVFSRKALEPVEEAFKRQRDLVANASHELKTPITIISTNLSVLKSEPSSTIEENKKWIESIESQLTRMNGLVTNMLNLSKMEHDEPNFENLDLSQIVEGAALNFEVVCFEKSVKLNTNITQNIHIMGEAAPIERVVTILLDNAIKYCGENGKIACTLSIVNKKARLLVLNTGQSISADEAKHVFDRFYRADGARKNPDNQSFGLGLAIAYATVTNHKGTISCRGVKGKGTIFEVLLPLAKEHKHYKKKEN